MSLTLCQLLPQDLPQLVISRARKSAAAFGHARHVRLKHLTKVVVRVPVEGLSNSLLLDLFSPKPELREKPVAEGVFANHRLLTRF